MSKTLIEIIQSVTNALDLTKVNSIDDDPVADQIALLAKDVFEEMSTNNEWAYKKRLASLSSSGDSTKPTHMLLNDDIANVEFIKYNTSKLNQDRQSFNDTYYVTPEEFLERTNDNSDQNADVDKVIDYSGVPLYIKNDRGPSFWTSFDDTYIVFDSYDSEVDSILQSSKVQAFVKKVQQFSIADDFVPDIPDYVYPHFMNELKSLASVIIKQTNNPKFEQLSRRQRRYLNQQNQRAGTSQTYPNYGRGPKKRVWGLGKLPQ